MVALLAKVVLTTIVVVGAGAAAGAPKGVPRTLCVCQAQNDLFRLLWPVPDRYDNVSAALASEPQRGDALLVLADDYPTQPARISLEQYAASAAAGLRMFIEFPAALPEGSVLNATESASPTLTLDAACHIPVTGVGETISRVVITNNLTAAHGLAPMRILGIHGATVVPVYRPAVPPCLQWAAGKSRAVGTAVETVLPTHDKDLCARQSGAPSHVRYDGKVCASDGSILWRNFSVRDTRGIPFQYCNFTCKASFEYCSTCGGTTYMPKIPELPNRLCAPPGVPTPTAPDPVFAVAARVAGYDYAVFGLPHNPSDIPVILFAATDSVLVATTSFSNVERGRFAPVQAWQSLIGFVLSWLGTTTSLRTIVPRVRPTYSFIDPLPADAEHQSVRRAVSHLVDNSGLLYSTLMASNPTNLNKYCPVSNTPLSGTDPIACSNEGFSSVIDWRGKQPRRNASMDPGCNQTEVEKCACIRTDDNAQVAVGIVAAGVLDSNRTRVDIGTAIIEYIYLWSGVQQKLELDSGDARDGSLGLVGWFTPPSMSQRNTFYGDNDGTVFLSSVAVAGLLPSEFDVRKERLVEPLLHQAFGNLRTTGQQGFRYCRTTRPEMQAKGWKWFFNSSMGANCGYDCIIPLQSNLWASYLWAGRYTGIKLFQQRVYDATVEQMKLWEASPNADKNEWQCVTTMSQNLAHQVFVLAFLVRVNSTAESRGWLDSVSTALISKQRECGSIQEFCNAAGCAAGGQESCFASSNEHYGTGEGGLIQSNDDPAADLLYTQNFALMSLHEAAMAVGLSTPAGQRYKHAADKLSAFFSRAQVQSTTHPSLDGGWLRGLDG